MLVFLEVQAHPINLYKCGPEVNVYNEKINKTLKSDWKLHVTSQSLYSIQVFTFLWLLRIAIVQPFLQSIQLKALFDKLLHFDGF